MRILGNSSSLRAKRSNPGRGTALDCFAATLLAMTIQIWLFTRKGSVQICKSEFQPRLDRDSPPFRRHEQVDLIDRTNRQAADIIGAVERVLEVRGN